MSAFETHHEHEYTAIRQGAGIIDISPLYKYLVSGPDATRLVNRVVTRDMLGVVPGQVVYTTWCDDHGKVIDDGTITRLAEDRYRWTAADPSYRWFHETARGLRVRIEDVSESVAALAVQGPRSAALLREVTDAPITGLKYFRMTSGRIAGVAVDVSRTGYTGDLGFEIWMPAARALDVWDAVLGAASRHGGRPAGMLALDMVRIEAGLLLTDVDFFGSRKALIDAHKYSPYEMGLERLVQLDKAPFIGREALRRERSEGPARRIVGLSVDWDAFERLHEDVGLPPHVPAAASRLAVPVYRGGARVGKATSTTWSPTLKKLIALATVSSDVAAVGTALEIEVTVDAARARAAATVVPTPFFNPPRKTQALG